MDDNGLKGKMERNGLQVSMVSYLYWSIYLDCKELDTFLERVKQKRESLLPHMRFLIAIDYPIILPRRVRVTFLHR